MEAAFPQNKISVQKKKNYKNEDLQVFTFMHEYVLIIIN